MNKTNNKIQNIEYIEDYRPSESELVCLYDSVGWSAYTKNPTQLKQAIDQSLWVSSLFDQEKLIGLIRVVGDGVSIIYVQDILIDPTYQHQGLGSQLLQKAMHKFEDVRQFVLMSDDGQTNNGFYKKNGLTKTSDANLVNYFRKHTQ